MFHEVHCNFSRFIDVLLFLQADDCAESGGGDSEHHTPLLVDFEMYILLTLKFLPFSSQDIW